jgi:hypothetical protein
MCDLPYLGERILILVNALISPVANINMSSNGTRFLRRQEPPSWIAELMKQFLQGLACLVLVTAFSCGAVSQTDDELRQMYFRRDFDRMEKLARDGDVRAEAWMGLIMQQASRRSEAKEWWQRAAEKGNAWAIDSLAMMYLSDKEDEKAAY